MAGIDERGTDGPGPSAPGPTEVMSLAPEADEFDRPATPAALLAEARNVWLVPALAVLPGLLLLLIVLWVGRSSDPDSVAGVGLESVAVDSDIDGSPSGNGSTPDASAAPYSPDEPGEAEDADTDPDGTDGDGADDEVEDDPATYADLIVDGGFESVVVPAGNQWGKAPSPGWSSSDPSGGVEVWLSGHDGVESGAGGQHLELNADGPTTISQTLTVVPDAVYDWSLLHRGRNGVDTITVAVDGIQQATLNSSQGAWTTHQGKFRTGPDQTTAEFLLASVGGGAAANFIDEVKVVRVRIGTEAEAGIDEG